MKDGLDTLLTHLHLTQVVMVLPQWLERAAPRPPMHEQRDRDRAAFWERLAVEAGVDDLHAFCRIAGRPPVYDDVGRSIQIIKERGRARRGGR